MQPLFEMPIKRFEDLIKIFIIDDNFIESDNLGKTTIPIDSIIPDVGKKDRYTTIPLFHNGRRITELDLLVSLKA